MTSALHNKQSYLEGVHSIVAYVYADATEREAASGFETADLWKVAYQEDEETFWVLLSTGSQWQQLGAGGGGGGSDPGPTYLVLSSTSSLNRERVLSVSGASGLIATDNGANSTLGLTINDNVVATLTGSLFSGPVSASAGLSGSLQRIAPNIPYLIGQGSLSITTQSNGQITLSSSISADRHAPYIVVTLVDALPNERALTQGTGLLFSDGGANSTFTISINDNIVAMVSGTRFTGPVSASAGLSGSLQNVGPNLPYLIAQGTVALTTQSNGQIIISGSGGSSPTAGTGIVVNGSQISINDNIVATVSGTRFTGPVSASGGLTGSLQLVGPGLPYLLSQGGITLITQSNGQIIISSSGGGGAGEPTAGTGILVNGSQVSINNNVVATISGTRFTGAVTASAGLSMQSSSISRVTTATFAEEFNAGNKGAASTLINWTSGQKQRIMVTGSFTASFTPPSGACNVLLRIIQDSIGSRTIRWPSTVKWPSGTPPTLSTAANSVDIVSFYYDEIFFYGVASLNFITSST